MNTPKKESTKQIVEQVVNGLSKNNEYGIQLNPGAYDLTSNIINSLGEKFNFLCQQDICHIMDEMAKPFCNDIRTQDQSILLVNALNPEEIQLLCANICNYLTSLPRKYSITFEIPLFQGTELFEYNDSSMGLSCNELVQTNNYLQRILKGQQSPTPNGLKCVVEGYCNSVNSDSFKSAWSFLKVIIQQGVSEKIFQKKPRGIAYCLSRPFSQEQGKKIPEFFACIEDISEGKQIKNALPDHVNYYIEQLETNVYDLQLSYDDNKVKNFFQTCYYIAYDSEMKSIKAACEWLFSSHTYEEHDISTAFLHLCFGLEALFTNNTPDKSDEKNEKPSITNMLASGCSRLIADTEEDRNQIEAQIRKIYSVRSCLVHGRQTFLKNKNKDLFLSGRTYLRLSIKKKIQMSRVCQGGHN